jgi:UrcA family protein
MSGPLKISCLSACGLIGFLAGPLNAGAYAISSLEPPPARVVRYGDLDLSRQPAAAVLYTRIKSAAREVCQPLDTWTLGLLREESDCREAAIGRAVTDVNSPELTAYYQTKNKARGTLNGQP